MDVLGEAVAQFFFQGTSRVIEPALVEKDALAALVRHPHGCRKGVGKRLESRLAFPQVFRRLDALGDIPADGHDGGFALVQERHGANLEHDCASVFTQEFHFGKRRRGPFVHQGARSAHRTLAFVGMHQVECENADHLLGAFEAEQSGG